MTCVILIANLIIGVPRRCEEDVEYQGVTIKKDDIVIACEW